MRQLKNIHNQESTYNRTHERVASLGYSVVGVFLIGNKIKL